MWTLYGAKDGKEKVEFIRDYVAIKSDGGTISVDWAYPPPNHDSKDKVQKVCIVFPGLSGHSEKGYVKSLVRHLSEERGFIVGVFHNRGVAQPFTSPVFPDIASSTEIETLLTHVQEKFADQETYIVGVGMSMGANLMLRVAGEQGDKCPLQAMVSLNNPFDVWLAINLMRNTPYEKYLAEELKRQLLFKEGMPAAEKAVFDQMRQRYNLNFEEIQRAKSWKEWDEAYTMKIFTAYKSLGDYYLAASSLPKVKLITKPTLVIHSRDDPIVPIDCLPVRECTENPNMIVGIVEKGGHVCYFQGVQA